MKITTIKNAIIKAIKDYSYLHHQNYQLADFTFYKDDCTTDPITERAFLQEVLDNFKNDGISIIWFNQDDFTLCTIKLKPGADLQSAIAFCKSNPTTYWELEPNIYFNLD